MSNEWRDEVRRLRQWWLATKGPSGYRYPGTPGWEYPKMTRLEYAALVVGLRDTGLAVLKAWKRAEWEHEGAWLEPAKVLLDYRPPDHPYFRHDEKWVTAVPDRVRDGFYVWTAFDEAAEKFDEWKLGIPSVLDLFNDPPKFVQTGVNAAAWQRLMDATQAALRQTVPRSPDDTNPPAPIPIEPAPKSKGSGAMWIALALLALGGSRRDRRRRT